MVSPGDRFVGDGLLGDTLDWPFFEAPSRFRRGASAWADATLPGSAA
jgi:acyl-CoA dehydrogenase